jgi:hypothetical protein
VLYGEIIPVTPSMKAIKPKMKIVQPEAFRIWKPVTASFVVFDIEISAIYGH